MINTWDFQNLTFSPTRLNEFLSTLQSDPLSFIGENSSILMQSLGGVYYSPSPTEVTYADRLSFTLADIGLHIIGSRFSVDENDFGVFGPVANAMVFTDQSTGETATVKLREINDVFQSVSQAREAAPEEQDTQINLLTAELFSGKDFILLGGEADFVDSGAGGDTINGLDGNDTLSGGDGRDSINGGTGDDVLSGGKNHDRITAGSGNDLLIGGAGNDRISDSNGNDTLKGGAGNDWLYDSDRKNSEFNKDILRGGDGNDFLRANNGRDKLFGGTGNDDLEGGADKDKLFGGTGDDTLDGEEGHDFLFGGTGNDLIFAGSYYKELGNDTLVFEVGAGQDTVLYFDLEFDVLEFRGFAGRAEDFMITEEKKDILIEIDDITVTLRDIAKDFDLTTDDLLLT